MAIYTGEQSVLNEGLGEYKDYGFKLIKVSDQILELYFKDKKIATYNRPLATITIIREGCKNFLRNLAMRSTVL